MKVLQKSPVAYEEARSCLLFDPDEHPGKRLKAFNKFIQCFQLWLDASYPHPPATAIPCLLNQSLHGNPFKKSLK